MPSFSIIRQSEIRRTAKVAQLQSLFDIQPSPQSIIEWNIDFELPADWNIGVIVGHSGAGKTTVARELFGEYFADEHEWDKNLSVIDQFPNEMSIKDITEILSSVGFSSPPSWLRPYHVLSTGEKFRVFIARHLAEKKMVVVDEYTSVIDRTVAQIGSHAIQKLVRRENKKFVAVTCHYDVLDWLQPDWVYEPHNNTFYGRWLHPRPQIELEIFRTDYKAFSIFAPYHYMNREINPSAICFIATLNKTPIAFSSWLHLTHATVKNMKREHRTACLPDYQGVGIGNALSETCASMFKSLGYRVSSTTANPSMIKSRAKSKNWKIIRNATMTSGNDRMSSSKKTRRSNVFTSSFEYVGHSMDYQTAIKMMGDKS